jgi:hypothetical protein
VNKSIYEKSFADVLNAAFQREGFVTFRSVAERLGVSVTTVKHWLDGKVVPHPNVQPHVIACVRECAVPPKD